VRDDDSGERREKRDPFYTLDIPTDIPSVFSKKGDIRCNKTKIERTALSTNQVFHGLSVRDRNGTVTLP
jgi:hypothetical protein